MPAVTVSLVTYNGMRWLPGCLASLERQTLRDFELLVLDNASTDGTLDWLREQASHCPWMTVQASDANVGFAAGQNRNIYGSESEFVCMLNQDVELDEHFLEQAVAGFEGKPRAGAVQGRLLQLKAGGERTSVIDTTGLVMFRSRRVVSRGQSQPDGRGWVVPGPVWGADGPAPVYRRSALMDAQEPRTGGGLEVFDEDFFMYKEDVDLAWRLRRRGWTTWYQPTALAWHGRTAGAGDASSLLAVARSNWHIDPWIKAISWRNQRLMQLKNESASSLISDLPWLVWREMLSLGFMILADRPRLRAVPMLARATPSSLRKRGRRVSSRSRNVA